jgi:hypothetical protein
LTSTGRAELERGQREWTRYAAAVAKVFRAGGAATGE